MAKGVKTGGGSRKGSPNKATAAAREAIARFVDGNADRLQGWLDEIHRDRGAEAAFGCFTSLLEYHVPKLQRSEVTGKDGEAQRIVITWGNPVD
jgi:hypothetical protein